ncbi:MAG: hypothetical protein JNK89_05035, partial [Saprospiraceae bacterium]|nr:hypothetical protein [Saprospiraceae bacterium]
HFEFTELSMNALQYLRNYYGTQAGDPIKYALYRDLYRQTQELWLMENEAEECYTELVNSLVDSRAPQQNLARTAEKHFLRIEPYLQQSDSFRLHLCGRLLQMMAYNARNDYRAMADQCASALRFFQAKPYSSNLPLQVFYYQLVLCCVQLRDFGRGQAIIRQHADVYQPGSFNWFKVQELYFLLALHTQHYDDAYDCCMAVLDDPQLERQPAQIQEMWKIFEAYVHLLVRLRRVDRRPEQPFRLAKFLNEIPVFSKDKRGMNIPILVAQLLFDLLERRYDASIDRADAVAKYTSRYIRRDEHFRSNCFLNMLLQVPQAAFQREAANERAQRFRSRLGEKPIELANQTHEIEIIPYEDLWEMALEMLPGKPAGA